MKVLAINGSVRREGNCNQCLEIMEKEFKQHNIELETVNIGANVKPCLACYHCIETGETKCIQTKDNVNEIIDKCTEADAIILASPVYHGGIAGNMKCALDRIFLAGGCVDNQFHHKVGAAFVTLRRSGGMETYQQLLGVMNAMEMVIVTSDYWNVIHGAVPGEVNEDLEGIDVIKRLAANMSWMLKVIEKADTPSPTARQRTMTNFVR